MTPAWSPSSPRSPWPPGTCCAPARDCAASWDPPCRRLRPRRAASPMLTAAPRRADRPGVPLRYRLCRVDRETRNMVTLTQLPAALGSRGIPRAAWSATLSATAPRWVRRATKALKDTPNVVWHGGRSTKSPRPARPLPPRRVLAPLGHRRCLVPALTALEPGTLGIPSSSTAPRSTSDCSAPTIRSSPPRTCRVWRTRWNGLASRRSTAQQERCAAAARSLHPRPRDPGPPLPPAGSPAAATPRPARTCR